jgi:undecaprenyl-diphosphatase
MHPAFVVVLVTQSATSSQPTLLQVIGLALLQGFTELFPVSSLGHTVIIPGLFGQHDLLQSDTFLPLVVMLHLGTATALLTFFWRDWVDLLRGGARVVIAGKLTRDVDPDGMGRQLALVVVGTIPAGLLGVFLQKPLESLFSQPILASAFLVANGAVLLAAERLWQDRQKALIRQKHVPLSPDIVTTPRAQAVLTAEKIGVSLDEMTFGQAALVGLAQSCALLPGISRSGSSMVGGMLCGLSHEAAARFSFLLATPIILGAGVLEVPKLFSGSRHTLLLALGGGVLAGLAAYLSVRFLMRYFETRRLDPFAYYCVGAGLLAFGFFLLQYLRVI